jgi:isopenicillin N synthase-like dioxygenase
MTVTHKLAELTWRELLDDSASALPIGAALGACGAFLLRDCPPQKSTPPAVLHDVTAQLFELPREVLARYAATDMKNDGGYMVGSGEWRSLALPDIWHVVSESNGVDGRERPPNVWPTEVPRLRGIVLPYHAQLVEVADAILAAIARSHGRPADYFAGMRSGGDDVLRLLHYRRDPNTAPPGFGGHQDLDLVTLLPRATDPGLEIEVESGVWESVEVPEDGLLVGVGAALSWLTGGEIPGMNHQVRGLVEAGVDERYAASFFVNPRPDAHFMPLRESPGEGTATSLTFEDFFRHGVRKALADATTTQTPRSAEEDGR